MFDGGMAQFNYYLRVLSLSKQASITLQYFRKNKIGALAAAESDL